MSKHMQDPWPHFVDICEPSTPIPDSDRVVRLGFDDYRRAKACVNACQGLGTGHLENQAMLGETLLDRFNLLNEESAELTKQRDELLAALQGIVGIASESTGVADYVTYGDIVKWGDVVEWDEACDAIAKAKGGAA